MKNRYIKIQVLFLGVISLLIICFSFSPVTPEKALKTKFPDADVVIKNYILTDKQQQDIEKLSGVKQDSKLISIYQVVDQGRIKAYGYVDVHVVRTQPEAVMYIINNNAGIDEIKILSFREPADYLAPEKWLRLFKDKSLEKNKIMLRDDISAISGATMTARAITTNCRKALAIWQVIYVK